MNQDQEKKEVDVDVENTNNTESIVENDIEPPIGEPSISNDLLENKEDFEKELESVIYVEGTISINRLSKIFMVECDFLRDTVSLINAKYKSIDSIIEILEVGDNFMMTVAPSVFGVLSRIYDRKRKKKISKPLLQTLSIIAYKQPITKAEIDDIRQSDSAYHVKSLLDEGFIEWKGRKDMLNKPQTYGTTDKFLMHFCISSINDLPKLRELKELEFDKNV